MRLSLDDLSGAERIEGSRLESHELGRKESPPTKNNGHQPRDKSVIDANIKRRVG